MSFYVAAYDTEAIYPWWKLGDRKYSAELYQKAVSYEREALQHCLAGVRAVVEVHLRHNAPATFFLVGKLLEHARSELRSILDCPIFDLQCHSYTHANLTEIAEDEVALKHELVDSKRLIEDTFGRPVIGLTSPGGFARGLLGHKQVLRAIGDAGYRYVRSMGLGPFDTQPAPLTQPFWYERDGFPDLLELGLHAWHDNHLTGQPCVTHWPPILPWGNPTGVPTTTVEAYQAYAPGIDYVVQHNLLTYIPCLHPWSIYRFDPKAGHVELLLQHARKAATIASCTSVYERVRMNRQLASECPA